MGFDGEWQQRGEMMGCGLDIDFMVDGGQHEAMMGVS
jgi:hypothetical protein